MGESQDGRRRRKAASWRRGYASFAKWLHLYAGNLLWLVKGPPVTVALGTSLVAWLSRLFYGRWFVRRTRRGQRCSPTVRSRVERLEKQPRHAPTKAFSRRRDGHLVRQTSIGGVGVRCFAGRENDRGRLQLSVGRRHAIIAKMTAKKVPFQEKWMEQWKRAESGLVQHKIRELRKMTPEQALAASEALLELGASSRLNPNRRFTSGLVEQQALFHKTSSA